MRLCRAGLPIFTIFRRILWKIVIFYIRIGGMKKVWAVFSKNL